MKKKLLSLALLASSFVFAQQTTFPEVTVQSYSPTVYLKRNTNDGGFTRGIQTQYLNGDNGWFFGDLHGSQWIVSKGDYRDQKFVINESGDVGIGTSSPSTKLDVNGNAKFSDIISGGSNSWVFHTPDDGRKSLHLAPRNTANDDWDWGKSFIINGANGNALLNGKFEAKEVRVTQSPTADFVFAENYDLPTLEDVEKHIKEKKHLPEIASAKVMEKEGVNVGEFQIKLLQKIEELTLYSIDQNKQIKQLHEENKILKSQSEEIKELKKQMQQLLTTKK
ncbi:hypothetical protein C1631_008815 [Chryseobacterium phosphatilyticum]|uniref:Cell wall anchor protein n=1 Tax=Chryseobacterium phosphatilyticum TaxID=475075 RepID=A0A316X8S1_9FLAO|nr:hypothetical protein [Chryseobacterium phosphatilyticum]PWN70087.1 hypothetical protein C1631_008815 [Chryseobacterium phosphatilyticum]